MPMPAAGQIELANPGSMSKEKPIRASSEVRQRPRSGTRHTRLPAVASGRDVMRPQAARDRVPDAASPIAAPEVRRPPASCRAVHGPTHPTVSARPRVTSAREPDARRAGHRQDPVRTGRSVRGRRCAQRAHVGAARSRVPAFRRQPGLHRPHTLGAPRGLRRRRRRTCGIANPSTSLPTIVSPPTPSSTKR